MAAASQVAVVSRLPGNKPAGRTLTSFPTEALALGRRADNPALGGEFDGLSLTVHNLSLALSSLIAL